MTRHLRSALIIGAMTLGPLGCSTDKTVDLSGPTGAALVDYAAAWDGHAEAYTFDDANGSTDHVRVTVNGDGTGTLRLGDIPLYPPATNFAVGYPAGAKPSDYYAGLVYPLHDLRVEENRLRFMLDPTDPFEDWCAHQTPYGVGSPPDEYYCIPVPLTTPADGTCVVDDPQNGPTPIDCLKGQTCLSSCRCSAAGCVAGVAGLQVPGSAVPNPEFDGALDENGTKLVGTLVMGASRVTLRLARP